MAGIDFGLPFSETGRGTATVEVVHAASSGKTYYITDITVSSDKVGSATVKNGTAVIWQFQTGSPNLVPFSHSFKSPLKGSSGASISISVSGASECYGNIAGYEL